ncbi:glycosyltransferase [Halolamina salina]|uniref:glycosyltransferase n=1 Tax=Halolamina salina TaxID=1220023 RepID=UPI0036088771
MNHATSLSSPDIVVTHDQMWTYGGAERVALHLGSALDAPVYTTYIGESAREAAIDLGVDVTAFAQSRYDGLGKWRRAEGFKSASLTLNWQDAPLEEFDLIFSAHMFSRHYRTLDHQYMLNYCHSPPRWLNDLMGHRLSSLPSAVRTLAKSYMTGMDVLDARSTDRVDAFVANSEVIRDRIRRYYRRDASIVYPPIETDEIEYGESDGEFYLMVGRVVESKRPKTVVEAFDRLDDELKIAGGADNEPVFGTSTFEEVRSLAGPNVEMLGYVADERKEELLRQAKAVVYLPVREDFGMVPIEALAAGTPVVAANEGFPAIAIEDGETGAVVEPTAEGVIDGVRRIEEAEFNPEALAAVAEQYSVDRFEERIREVVSRFCEEPERYRAGEDTLR